MKLFFQDFLVYIGRASLFKIQDWIVYLTWVGLMFGLFIAVTTFILVGYVNDVQYPPYVWNIPLGTFIFSLAIAIDTIGHRTVYKEELRRGENLVHHITIFAGITSVLGLCLAYQRPDFFRVPSLVLILLSIIYSLVDEILHWVRYLTQKSDRIEMWSHFFILLGHFIMIFSWWYWFDQGYPGVKETLEFFS